PSTPPRGTIAFVVAGGSGAGYAWSLATNASGGSIDAATGAYVAGTTGNVTDVVHVVDSLANEATVNVGVGPGVTVTPRTASVAPNEPIAFAVSGGSGKGYAWSLAASASGASIDGATGAYVAGRTGGVDVVRVVDSLGNGDSATIQVTSPPPPPLPPPPAEPSGCNCQTTGSSNGPGFLVLLLAAAVLRLRRRTRP
ncbi:MAG TPA: MYXO-CTERM sorting domain-containing protein, partial [Polyangiaceae bacterium]